MESDQELIDQIKGGNQSAFVTLVEKYRNYVFTIALSVIREREDAEEIAQDVFVKVYQMLNSFQGTSSFKTWLYSVTYRTAIDYTRKKKKHRHSELDQNLSLADTREGNKANRDHLKTVLNNLIARLKPEDAGIITLFYLEELSVKEISEITGLNASNIKTRLFRMREQLRNIMETEYQLSLTDLL